MKSSENKIIRQGLQKIPRPQVWSEGAKAPWAELEEADKKFSLRFLEKQLLHRAVRIQETSAPPPKRNSAVLIALYEKKDQVTVILTRRTKEMRSHSGEVSFPGGGQEPDENLWHTAVREANEEIDLNVSLVRRIGELDHLTTISSQSRIVPYVAVLSEPPELRPNPAEVAAILEVPLNELLLPGVYREEKWRWPTQDSERRIFFFEIEGDTIWGATANLLRQLLVIGLGDTSAGE